MREYYSTKKPRYGNEPLKGISKEKDIEIKDFSLSYEEMVKKREKRCSPTYGEQMIIKEKEWETEKLNKEILKRLEKLEEFKEKKESTKESLCFTKSKKFKKRKRNYKKDCQKREKERKKAETNIFIKSSLISLASSLSLLVLYHLLS